MTEDNSVEEADKLVEEELDIPTFQRGTKVAAHKKLLEDADDPAKLGGSYSILDPMHPADLTGTGVVTRPMKIGDIKTITVDTAGPGLTRDPKPNT